MTPEKKKLWLYAGGATALTLLVYFIFFNKPADKKTPPNPNPNPKPKPPKPSQDFPEYPEYPEYPDPILEPTIPKTMIVEAKSGTRLRKDPNTNSAIIKTYKGGEQLFVKESKKMSDGEWYLLKDRTGWVRSDVVDIINAGF
jgi:hypothetical protein